MSNANVLNLGKTPAATVLKLSWPTILEQVAVTVLNFADTAMVGVLGASYTAAVGITAPVLWLIGGITAAVSIGFSVQVAQSVGANDLRQASHAAGQSVLASAATGLVILLVCLLCAPVLPGLLGADPAIHKMATDYFCIMGIASLFSSIEVNMSSILRCTGNTKSPMIANSIAIFLNILLNWLFIYPTRTIHVFGSAVQIWGGDMGVAGAALGSALSLLVAGLLLLPAFLSTKRGIRLQRSDLLRADGIILKRAAEIGTPVAMERITLSLGQVAFMRIISTLGTTAVAAHHLAVQAESLSYMPSFGFSLAATTLVGQSMGAEDRTMARRFGQIAANMAAVTMTLSGVLLFFFAEPLIGLFSRDAQVVLMGGMLLRIVAFAQPPQALAGVYSGALRGTCDTKWPFYINLIGVWGVRVLLTALFVFGFGWGLVAAWVAMLLDLTFRGIVCRKRFLGSLQD